MPVSNNRPKSKRVVQYTMAGERLAVFDSAGEAAQSVNTSEVTLRRSINGFQKTHLGYVWRYEGDPFDKYPVARKSVPRVFQYTKAGEFVREYPSGTAAAKELGISSTAIYHCCRGQAFSAGGFVWRFEGVEPVMRERQKPGTEGRPIRQYTRSGEFIREYPNIITAAKQLGLSPSIITQCCRGMKMSAGDTVWRYADDPPSSGDFPVQVPRVKPVIQYNSFGKIIGEYDSAKTAEQQTGVSASSICHCCKGNTRSAGGFVWQYSDSKSSKP